MDHCDSILKSKNQELSVVVEFQMVEVARLKAEARLQGAEVARLKAEMEVL